MEEQEGLVVVLIVLINHIIREQLLTLELHHIIGLKGCLTVCLSSSFPSLYRWPSDLSIKL